ncbi:MAG TPA: hypothetical protein VF591_23920, partial [Pyrinomonadaceae bacterium]
MDSTLKKSLARGFALAALASLMTVMSAVGAQAQWATSGTTTSTTNNVGVGTSTPSSTLEVQGPDGTLTLSQPGVPGKAVIQAAVGTDLHMSANARWTTNFWSRNDASLPSWNFFLAPGAGADYAGLRRAAPSAGGFAWTDIMRVTNTGSIGFGTTTPGTFLGGVSGSGRMLHVLNAADHAQLLLSTSAAGKLAAISMEVGDASQTRRVFQTRYDGANNLVKSFFFSESSGAVTQDNVLVLKNDGNVGIGTGAPQHRLDVSGNVTIGSGYTSSTQVPVDGLVVQGGVGIGTPNPGAQYKLDVAGDVRISGNINAKYQDVAEWVPSTQKLQAGTVVILDVSRDNHVTASMKSYDTRVAGVVSAQPGISLGEAGEGKALVATTGRVKVRVDASRGAVRVGDLLVTSDVPGVAMLSQPLDLGGVPI